MEFCLADSFYFRSNFRNKPITMIKQLIISLFLCLSLNLQGQDTTIYLNFHIEGEANVHTIPFKNFTIYYFDAETREYKKLIKLECFGEFSIYHDSEDMVTNYKVYYRTTDDYESSSYYSVSTSQTKESAKDELIVNGVSNDAGKAKFVISNKDVSVKYYYKYSDAYEDYGFYILLK